MSKASYSTRQTLADHSAAKVRVFSRYLGIYLHILGRVGIERVHIYDLMCGEGEYADGRQGSALAGLQEVLAYFGNQPAEKLAVRYVLNDGGTSDMEPHRYKIDRVKEKAVQLRFDPAATARLEINYFKLPLAEAMAKAIVRVQGMTAHREKALLFIDPWGYKDIHTTDLQAALAGGHSEVLLFLPTEMMYRFASKAYYEDFGGGQALQNWLTELFPEALPNFADTHAFIRQLRDRLQARLDVPWASHFTLETPNRNTYALFYFTCSRKGLEKMLESQWKEDPDEGTGHRANQTFNLFPPGVMADYPARVEAYLAAAPNRSNEDLLEFGLREGFLPKHTADVLRSFAGRLQVWEPEGTKLRKNAFYLNDPDRQIRFALTS